jgi:ribose transport system substrate-binding protein
MGAKRIPRFANVSLLAVLAFGLPTRGAAADAASTIGMVIADEDPQSSWGFGPYYTAIKSEAERRATQLGVHLIVKDSKFDRATEAKNIEAVAAEGVKGILLVPIGNSNAPVIEKVVKAGVPVVTISEKAGEANVLLHVGVDDVEVGRAAARFIIDRLGNKGGVVEIEGPGELWLSSFERKAGFDEIIRGSKVKLLHSETGGAWNRTRAGSVIEEALAAHKKFGAVFAARDEMIVGAIKALSEAHIDPAKMITVGVDASDQATVLIRQGKLTASIDVFLTKQVDIAVDQLVAFIKDGTVPPQKIVLVKPEVVTKATLASR